MAIRRVLCPHSTTIVMSEEMVLSGDSTLRSKIRSVH